MINRELTRSGQGQPSTKGKRIHWAPKPLSPQNPEAPLDRVSLLQPGSDPDAAHRHVFMLFNMETGLSRLDSMQQISLP
ncbi:hypothetical protein Tco_1063985 [Tanacetum coccineum]